MISLCSANGQLLTTIKHQPNMPNYWQSVYKSKMTSFISKLFGFTNHHRRPFGPFFLLLAVLRFAHGANQITQRDGKGDQTAYDLSEM